jgi:2-oxoglutarate dehydrogenase E2 component (dihydrolipoamide succinyltransferase)
MPATTVVMPQLGESVVEGTVVRWLVKPGQRVARDEPLVEVATDKANTEIPSPSAGVLVAHLAPEGAVVPVGGALCSLDDAAVSTAPAAPAAPAPAASAPAAAHPSAPAPVAAPAAQAEAPAAVDASPVARNIAQEHGVDLGSVQGTGPGGRIVKADVLVAAQQQKPFDSTETLPIAPSASAPPPVAAPAPQAVRTAPIAAPVIAPVIATLQVPIIAPPIARPTLPPPPAYTPGFGPIQLSLKSYKPPRYTPKDGDQIVPFDQRRRLIAEHMVYSKATSPHVPCTAEVDMSGLTKLREEWKKSKETGGKAPSFLVGICRATVQALSEFPKLNAVVQDEAHILRKDINLGVAVETEKGLLVPVIRKANEKSVLGLSRSLDELALKARTGKVTADELSGGSFTVSNPGLKGNLFGAAIINQPQVGILRMGEIVKRAVVRNLDGQDAIVIRPMMYLTLSYDHRVIDGVNGNGFLFRVKELIEAAQFPL